MKNRKKFLLLPLLIGVIISLSAFFSNSAHYMNFVYAEENIVETIPPDEETADIVEDVIIENQEEDDVLTAISDFIDEIWGKVSVWVPATLLPSLLVVWRIIKSLIKLVTSKNQKNLTDEAIKNLQKEASELKTKLIDQVEKLQKYTDILEQLIVNQINPKIRDQLNNALNALKELNVESDEELAGAIAETEEVLKEIDVNEEKYVYTGD